MFHQSGGGCSMQARLLTSSSDPPSNNESGHPPHVYMPIQEIERKAYSLMFARRSKNNPKRKRTRAR
eukprot:904243-Pyramimonas_sp.AAC.1